ncbi:MAG TPA: SRPBCC family protein [Erysipelothrix sp.]|nr:SRPBCC family protein [Erysipelothrix sp.]
MPKQSIEINKSPQEVYAFLEHQLAAVYKVDVAHLLNATTNSTLQSSKGTLPLKQQVTEIVVNERIRFESKYGKDQAITEYRLEPSEVGCLLTLQEEGSSEKFSRRLNFKLFSLPFFRSYAERRLATMLQNIKQQLETDPQNDSH